MHRTPAVTAAVSLKRPEVSTWPRAEPFPSGSRPHELRRFGRSRSLLIPLPYAHLVARPNILFITLDQFRSDALSCAGHPIVRTPNLDALAADGIRLSRHYAQAAPCSPGRAALYTGTYQMNNRVVGNGTPLDDRFDNIARAAHRGGYDPVMFGYTDQGVDPRTVAADDPRLSTYEGVLPGFTCELDLSRDHGPWLAWLADLGYDDKPIYRMLQSEGERPVEHSLTSFLTDRFLGWHEQQTEPWFAHLSYLRPHPPYNAAGHFATMYDPAQCGATLPIPEPKHPVHEMLLGVRDLAASKERVPEMQAQYFGMVSEVDYHLGRLFDALEERDDWANTVVVVTADHGEQLGDQGLRQKAGYFESSYHIIGIVRDPRHRGGAGTVVTEFTENVDLFPTMCEAMGIEVPAQCDGMPLTPFLKGERPPWWRTAAFYEWDWRDAMLEFLPYEWPWDRGLERCNLAVRRSDATAYVQFGDGDALCFDLRRDPTWSTQVADPHTMLADAQAMLVWRSQHLDRTLTDFVLRDGGVGRWPSIFSPATLPVPER
jgi:arylsulfatase A-like enzyme